MILESVHLDHERKRPRPSDRSEQEVDPLLRCSLESLVDLDLRFDRPQTGRVRGASPQNESATSAGQHLRSQRRRPVEFLQSSQEPFFQHALHGGAADGLVDPGFGLSEAVPFLKNRLHHLVGLVPAGFSGPELGPV